VSEAPSIPEEKPRLPRFVKTFTYLLLAVLVIVGGWIGFRFAKLHLALAHARREFSNRQFMRAEFWTNRAFSVDAKNIEATRLMAEINEEQDNPAALGWRIKLAQREPGNTGNIMAWAKCALRFDQSEMAINALKALPKDFKSKSAEYHELIAGFALTSHEIGLAEAHFLRAAELDSANPVYRVNVAAFRLMYSPSPEVRAAAARDLENELADSRVTLFAARTLLSDAIQSGDRARTQRFAEKLRSLPERNFSDELSCLEAVMPDPAFHPALEKIEHRAESDARWTVAAGDWLNSRGMAAETVRWFDQLPKPTESNIRVQMTLAEAYLALHDWSRLQTFLAKCHWENGEYLRRAMLIRCKRELSQPWEREWNQLATEVEANPPDSLLLAQLVVGWNWRNKTLDLLWGASTKPETESKALEYLWGLYSRTNETRELLRVATAQLKLDPSNPTKKNNEAFLSLLLYGASERSERLAREASATNPRISEWAATYAYALHLNGKDDKAKQVMEKLPPEALNRPGVALYYAIILAANGNNAQAGETLAKLNQNGMLPEEQKLAADLAQQLNPTSH